MKRWMIIAAAALAMGIIAGAGYFGYKTSQAATATPPPAPPTVPVSKGDVVLSVTAPGTSVNTHTNIIDSSVAAQVDQILVHPGDPVKAGQVLARLGDRADFETALTNAQIEQIQAQQALDALDPAALLSQARVDLVGAQKALDDAKRARLNLDYRSTPDQIAAANANLVMAQNVVDDKQQAYDSVAHRPENDNVRAFALAALENAKKARDKALINLNWYKGKADPKDIAEADANVSLAQDKLDAAQKKVGQLQDDDYPDLALARARLKNAQAGLDKANAALKNLEVTAPYDGVITEVTAKEGQTVAAGGALMTLIDPRAIDVEATVVEEDLPLVQIGQSVQLYFDALPDSDVTGKVARVIPVRVSGTSQANYTIVITLDHPVEHLVAGMSVDGSIVVSQKTNVLRLSRSVVHAQPDGTAIVEIWDGTEKVQRKIRVGLRGDSYSEVLDGLQQGDLVVAQ